MVPRLEVERGLQELSYRTVPAARLKIYRGRRLVLMAKVHKLGKRWYTGDIRWNGHRIFGSVGVECPSK